MAHHHYGVVNQQQRSSGLSRPPSGKQTLSLKDSELIFRSIDLNGDGIVSLDELKRCMMGDTSSSIFVEGGDGNSKIKQYMIDDIFSIIDEDGSGGIDLGEFQRVMGKQLGGVECGCNNDDYACNTCDSNDNDEVEETLAFSNERVRGCIFQKFGRKTAAGENNSEVLVPTRKMLRTIFDTMDINKDGVLQLSEAITVLRETPGLDEDMISGWADKADIDLNGEIDFEEFCAAMMDTTTRESHE